MTLVQQCVSGPCCSGLSYVIAFSDVYSFGVSNVVYSGFLMMSVVYLVVRLCLARKVVLPGESKEDQAIAAAQNKLVIDSLADDARRPLLGSDSFLRPDGSGATVLVDLYVTLLWIMVGWFCVQTLMWAIPAGQFARILGYMSFTVHATLDNIPVGLGFASGKLFRRRHVVYSVAASALFALAKVTLLLVFTAGKKSCDWCVLYYPMKDGVYAYWAYVAVYVAVGVTALVRGGYRRAFWPWLLFLAVVHVGVAVGGTFTMVGMDTGFCVLSATSVFYAFLYGPAVFHACAADSRIVQLTLFQQALASDGGSPPADIGNSSIRFSRRQQQQQPGGNLQQFGADASPPPARRDDDQQLSSTQKLVAPIVAEYSLALIPYQELRFDKCIGSGGFGEVYSGFWGARRVAVKKLLASSRGDALHEFLKELGILAKLNHDNIVRLFGICCERNDQFIVLEFCAGGSVFDFIHHGGDDSTLDWPLARSIAMDTASGMAYLHSFEPPILHRDLKSQNILLSPVADGEACDVNTEATDLASSRRFTAKLCDFGLSRVRADATMSRIGTVQWVAPEVLREERYSEKADVWSFGVIVWELSAKRIPFRGVPAIRVASNVAFRNWKLPISEGWPSDLSQIMRSCWQPAAQRPTFPEIINMFSSNGRAPVD